MNTNDDSDQELPPGFLDLVVERSSLSRPLRPSVDPNPPPPAAGQVWRAEWEGTIALVAVSWTGRDDEVGVAPISEDVGLADGLTVLVDAEASPLGYAFGVWVSPSAAIPRLALDLHLGDLTPSDRTRLTELLDAARQLPDDPVDLTYPLAAHRDALEGTLDGFDELRRLLTGDEPPRASLDELVSSAGMGWKALATEASVDPRDLLKVRRGVPGVLDDDAVARLASTLGLPVGDVAAALPGAPAPLRIALHQPRHRRQVSDRADHNNSTVPEVRRVVVRELVGARRRQRPGAEDWEELLDTYFGAGP